MRSTIFTPASAPLSFRGHGTETAAVVRDAWCSGAATTTVVDSPNDVGSFSSLAIGADGLPLVTYRDVTNNGVRVAHCPNVFCVGYLRRR